MSIEDIKFLSRDQLRNNLIIIRIGNDYRPASDEDIEDAMRVISLAIENMNLDFDPAIIVTHHAFTVDEARSIKELENKLKESFTEFERFEIMEL